MVNENDYKPEEVKMNEWAHASCDKYDYMAAAFVVRWLGWLISFLWEHPE